MSIVHKLLGMLILFIDWLTTPNSIKREDSAQSLINKQTQSLTLYQYKACPFCVKVRRSMKRHALPIETRDPKRSETAKQELIAGAGKLKVPCLKIEDDTGEIHWMFESNDIISYLEQRFTKVA